jgi:hypothetical protein
MSQPSHLCEMFVDNVVTSGHQARTMAFNYSLEAQNKISKEIKIRIQGNEWARKQLHL